MQFAGLTSGGMIGPKAGLVRNDDRLSLASDC